MKERLANLISKTDLTNIKIEYKGETIEFDLIRELKINQHTLNQQLKEQPSHYGFLLLLQSNIQERNSLYEATLEKHYSKIYSGFKDEIDSSTGRPRSKELAEALTKRDIKYNRMKKKLIHYKKELSDINSCVKAFENRGSLIQTLSANKRKERE